MTDKEELEKVFNDSQHWEDLYDEITPYLAGDDYEIRRKTNGKTD